MFFKSTRSVEKVTSIQALLKGISEDGGLYIPEYIPKIEIDRYINYSYKDLCHEILSKFIDVEERLLKECIEHAYNKFESKDVAPVKILDRCSFIELFHGPTLAFKDVALTLLPKLLEQSLKIESIKKDVLIITATSGDTGSAALEGFKDIDNIKIIIIYPSKGISLVQRLQMTSNRSKNVTVCSLEGNFDNAQKIAKDIFVDKEFNKKVNKFNFTLSSANSINIGRLLPQVVYYFSSYFKLVNSNKIKMGDKIDVVVPTGNFGNILASYYAKEIGLPIDKFICASNKNNILTDFFKTGKYDTNRKFHITSSPSMDILVSSNLERLLYMKLGEDKVKILMENLKNDGEFIVDKNLFSEFYGDFASEDETEMEIRRVYEEEQYLIDPHTAVASFVGRKYLKEHENANYQLIAATASPFKFPKVIAKSLNIDIVGNDFECIDEICKFTGLQIPEKINKIKNSEETYKEARNSEDIKNTILNFIK